MEDEVAIAVATAMGEVARVMNFERSVSTADQLLDKKCDVVMGPAAQGVEVLSTQPYLHLEVEMAPRVMNVHAADTRLLAIEKARPAIELAVTRAGLQPVARLPQGDGADLTSIQGAEFE